jgi:hypothetical protein
MYIHIIQRLQSNPNSIIILIILLVFAFDVKYVLEEFSRLIVSRLVSFLALPFYLLCCGIQTQGEMVLHCIIGLVGGLL